MNMVLNLLIKLINTSIEKIDSSLQFNYSEKINTQMFLILISFLNRNILNIEYHSDLLDLDQDLSMDEEIVKDINDKSILNEVKEFSFGSNILEYMFQKEYMIKKEAIAINDKDDKTKSLNYLIGKLTRKNIQLFINKITDFFNDENSNSEDDGKWKTTWKNKLEEQPFIYNTLLLLYRDVMIPVKVITKISDIQCNKGQPFQERNLHDFLFPMMVKNYYIHIKITM